MTDNARARKLADRIQVVVAETLDRRIKDPRLGFVTITDARVTGDLREATVFYTVYGDDEERAASAAALESAKGVLRSEVGRQTGVRFTPTLAFVPDALPDNARTIEDLLDKARAKDAEVREVSTGATYAGRGRPVPQARGRGRVRRPRREERGPDLRMTEQTTTPDGLVIVDKPSGFTSHDVVAKMRGIARTRRVGHASARWTRWRPGSSCWASSGPPSSWATSP